MIAMKFFLFFAIKMNCVIKVNETTDNEIAPKFNEIAQKVNEITEKFFFYDFTTYITFSLSEIALIKMIDAPEKYKEKLNLIPKHKLIELLKNIFEKIKNLLIIETKEDKTWNFSETMTINEIIDSIKRIKQKFIDLINLIEKEITKKIKK